MATDLQMLRALLLLPVGRLSMGDRRPFQNMYDDLVNGKIVHLSIRQRAWVEEAFRKHDLAGKELPPKEARVKHPEKVILDFGLIPKPPWRK